MSILNSKTKKNITTVCPVCGHEQITEVVDTNLYYMDGTKQLNLSEILSRYVVCDKCKMIYDALDVCGTQKTLTDEYTKIAAQPITNLVKIQLLQQKEHIQQHDLLVAYAKEECNESAWIQAVQNAINDDSETVCLAFDAEQLPQIRIHSMFVMDETVRKIDWMRQIGMFEEARVLINQLRQASYFSTPYSLFEYLNLEEKLIAKRNRKMH